MLENGNGSPGSLAVLYLELCSRLGLDLHPVALEGGRWGTGQAGRQAGRGEGAGRGRLTALVELTVELTADSWLSFTCWHAS